MTTLLNSDETFLSLEFVTSIIGIISLILYHYFFTRNNINFLNNDVKLLKKNLKDLSDTMFTMINDKTTTLEDKYIDKINNINVKMLEDNKHINNILKELKINETKYKDLVKEETKQTNDVFLKHIDELRKNINTNDHLLAKLETTISTLEYTNTNSNNEILKTSINMLNNSISNLKEINEERYNSLKHITTTHRVSIDNLHDKLFNYLKDK